MLAAAGALLLAVAIAVAVAQVLMQPPRGDLVQLAAYVSAAGGASVVTGAALLWLLDRRASVTLSTRFVAVALVTAGVLVVNIVVLARLMFISTQHDLQVILATVAAGAVLAVAFARWAAGITAARVARVNAGIRALAAGERGTVADAEGTDEVASLARDLNALACRLRDAEAERDAIEAERRYLTAAVSHDLRTPLSTILAMVDALEDGIVTGPSETRRYFVAIRRDISRLDHLIEDLMELARIDAGAMQLRRQPLAIEDVVAEAVDAMRARAEGAGIALSLRVEAPLPPVDADGDQLVRAVSNLLRNALEHTPRGGEVVTTVRARADRVAVEVADSGEGIEGADLPHVWTRFYRAERSRTRAPAAGGVGLGLAITKGIVELHGGTVGVRSTRGEGSAFELSLPAR